MSNKNCLLNIILFIFVHLVQSQPPTVDTIPPSSYDMTTGKSINDGIMTFESTSTLNPTSISTITDKTADYSTTPMTMMTSISDHSATVDAHTVSSSMPNHLTNLSSTSSHISITSTSTVSAVTTASIVTNIPMIYRYTVGSQFPLQYGTITNRTVLDSVQGMVLTSFNLTNFFNLTVTSIEIKTRTKAISPYEYDMLVYTLFISSIMCNLTCIESSKLTSIPTQNFTLPDVNGTLRDVYPTSGPLSPNVIETTSVTSPKRESPPGLAAQLGMGLGISIIAVLLTAEIIFLYRKYGISNRSRERSYGISMSSIR